MQNTNTINSLFHIPDEGSFIKKLILSHPSVYNPDVPTAFEILDTHHHPAVLQSNEHYFSLLLPTASQGLQLEAMIITTGDADNLLVSVYHRLHFDPDPSMPGVQLIEADAFLRLNAVVVNLPYQRGKVEALASLLNYQLQEALNIEITMLTLADGDHESVEQNIYPFIYNTLGRYALACVLDDIEYESPRNEEALSHLIATYCDLPLLSVAKGMETMEDFEEERYEAEEMFCAEFASSTLCMMLFLMEQKTASVLVEENGITAVKDFFLKHYEKMGLKKLTAEGEHLGSFTRLGV